MPKNTERAIVAAGGLTAQPSCWSMLCHESLLLCSHTTRAFTKAWPAKPAALTVPRSNTYFAQASTRWLVLWVSGNLTVVVSALQPPGPQTVAHFDVDLVKV